MAAREILARLGDVGADLPRERVEIRVALLVAELVQELDDDAPAVDHVVEVEDEDLEQRLALPQPPSGARQPRRRHRAGRASSPCTRTAKTPETGGIRLSRRFAVGKPRLRPSFAPCATRPAIVYGRPRSAAACSRLPADSACRTAVDDARSPSTATVRIASTLNDLRRRAQGRDVAGATFAEAKVLADEHPADAEARARARRR